jgi:predicted dehydrogenase
VKDEVRIALIGAGYAGQAHAFGYRNVAMSDALGGVRVVLDTVADPNLELARSVQQRYGFARAVPDIDDILSDPAIDAVSVALPNGLYATVLPRLFAAGKHVLAEKPLGISAAEAETLTRRAEASGKIAGVGFSFRRIPGLAALQRAVAKGRIGQPWFTRAYYYADYAVDPSSPRTWRFAQELSGGGALMDIGIHVIDTLEYTVGHITEVSTAVLSTVVPERPLPVPGGIGHAMAASSTERGPVTNDDTALLVLRFDGPAVASVQLSRVAAGRPNELGLEVYGSDGHVTFDSTRFDEFHLYERESSPYGNDGPRRIIAGPEFPYFDDVSPMSARGVATGYGEAFIAEIQEFIGSVRSGKPMDTNFATATQAMRVIQAALDASRSGQAVAVPPPLSA